MHPLTECDTVVNTHQLQSPIPVAARIPPITSILTTIDMMIMHSALKTTLY